MSGRLTIWIGGREALPVRAIPYLTSWQYSPDVVAESLAGKAAAAPFDVLRNLVAYQRQAPRARRVMRYEWDAVVVQIKGVLSELREQRPHVSVEDDDAGYAAWRRRAAKILPTGVYVWLDEFVRQLKADWKRALAHDHKPLIYAPMLDAETRAAVLEGFEDCPRSASRPNQATTSDSESVAIFHADDPKNFGGLRVEANGLCMILPEVDVTLTPEERAAVAWHPPTHHDETALPLPCTPGQLRAFLPDAGMAGCIDEEAVGAVPDEREGRIEELPADSGREGDAVKVGAGATAAEDPDIPGKLPRVAIGQLAVTAGWQIECESGRAATADKVIKRLQAWATGGEYPDILLRAEPRKRAVIWMTKKTRQEKTYDVDACGKALDEWRKSRA